jgi:hypothetical protein
MPQYGEEHPKPAFTDEMQAELRRCLANMHYEPDSVYTMGEALRAEWLVKLRDAVGECDLCGEPVGEHEQAEVVERATGKHLYVHAEGCHDAWEESNVESEYVFA